MVPAVCLGAVLASSGVAGAGSTAATPTTAVPVPKSVTTDIRQARADLQALGTVLAGLGSQQRAAESELDSLARDMNDGNLPRSSGSGAAGASSADEVSAAIAQLFSAHAHQYAALAAQAEVVHEEFVNTITAAAGSYAAAEATRAP